MPVFSSTPIPTDSGGSLRPVSYLINRTFDLLLGGAREERNQLNSPIDSSQTTFNVNYGLGSLRQGTYLCIDQEVMYVWAATAASGNSSSVTVQRGDRGTTATTHAANAIIQVDPYFTRYQVAETLRDEIRSWAPQVFTPMSITITSTNYVRGYDLGILGEWFHILNVTESPDTSSGLISDNLWASVPHRVDRSADTAVFPSGSALYITSAPGVFDSPRQFQVTYAAPINVTTTFNETDLLGTMGLNEAEIDIPPYGAAWRLASGREVRRMLTEAQGQNNNLQNFPAGYMVKAAEDFKVLRDSRLKDAEQRIRAAYPIRRTG